MSVPDGTLPKDDIRFVYDKLAGGANMDLIYGYSATRFFTSAPGAQRSPPCVVLNGKARRFAGDRQIDEAMDSTLLFPTPEGKPDVRSTVRIDMCKPKWGGIIPRFWDIPIIVIELQQATITFNNFAGPHLYHSIVIHNKETGISHTQKHYSFGPKWGARSEPWWSTYRYQLEAFVAKIQGEEPPHWIGLDESLEVMEIVDRVYEVAGMVKRGL